MGEVASNLWSSLIYYRHCILDLRMMPLSGKDICFLNPRLERQTWSCDGSRRHQVLTNQVITGITEVTDVADILSSYPSAQRMLSVKLREAVRKMVRQAILKQN